MFKNAFILNFFKLYNMVWKLAIPFLAKNQRLKHGFKQRVCADHLKPCNIWIQAASAGEAKLAANIIQTLAPEQKLSVLVTTLTTQGMDILKATLKPHHIHPEVGLDIQWFPFDAPDIMKTAVQKANPAVMVLLETEIWPGLLGHLKQNNTRIIIANARLSKKSSNAYKNTRFIWKHLEPELIMATSEQDAMRYKQVFKTTDILTMSNMKFESLSNNGHIKGQAGPTARALKKFIPSSMPFTILASVRKPEETMIIKIIKALFKGCPDQVIAVFPRHMHRIHAWQHHLKKHGIEYRLRSKLRSPARKHQVILWDTFGELNGAYSFASTVFVGASLVPLGGQNFLEPLLQGAFTVTGPHYDDFQWAAAVFKDNLVIQKTSWKKVSTELLNGLRQDNLDKREKRKKQMLSLVRKHSGGSENVCKEIMKSFDGSFK